MKGLVKTAAVALAATGISNTVPPLFLYPDHTTEITAEAPQRGGGTGLSFEDLRVGPMGKVRVGIGSTEVPVRVAENSSCTDGGGR
jgi:hypothetical protein